MMIQEHRVEPTGDVRKDLMMFNQAYGVEHSDEILRGIEYLLNLSAPSPDSGRKTERIDDLSNLDEDELPDVQTEIVIRGNHFRRPAPVPKDTFSLVRVSPERQIGRLRFFDVHCLSKAIACCYFNIRKIHLVECGLSSFAIRQLCRGFRFVRQIDEMLIERNKIFRRNEELDKKALAGLEESQKQFLKIQPLMEQPHHKTVQRSSVLFPASSIEASSGRRHHRSSASSAPAPPNVSLLKIDDCLGPPSSRATVVMRSYGKKSFCPFAMLLRHRIRHLCLRDCGITDSQVIGMLAPILKVHSSIRSLSLWGNRLSDRCCSSLGSALLSNKSLLGLNLSLNPRITDEGFTTLLKKAFGRVQITGWGAMQRLRSQVYKSALGEEFVKHLAVLVITGGMKKKSSARALAAAASSSGVEELRKGDPAAYLPWPTWMRTLISDGHFPNLAQYVPSEGGGGGKGPEPTPPLTWDNEVKVISAPVVVVEVEKKKKPVRGAGAGSKKPRRSGRGKAAVVEEKPPAEEPVVEPPKPWIFEVRGNSTLQVLNLSSNRKVTDASVKEFVERVGHTGIRSLNVGFTQVTDGVLQDLGRVMVEAKAKGAAAREVFLEEEKRLAAERAADDSGPKKKGRKKRSARK